MLQRGLQHVGVDQHGQHAQRLIVLDEAHAAHVRREIVDFVGALGGGLAIVFEVQVEREILDIVEALIPLVERLDVHGANLLITLFAERGDEMTADKTAGPGYDYTIMSCQFNFPFGLEWSANSNELSKIKVTQIQSETKGRGYIPLRRMRMERRRPYIAARQFFRSPRRNRRHTVMNTPPRRIQRFFCS